MILQLMFQSMLVLAGSDQQRPLNDHRQQPFATAITTPLFASLERFARLVDTSYCLGSTGIHKPFECLSRCKEFPELTLVNTWSTGIFFGDSCGFIAVDHGNGQGPLYNAEQPSPATENHEDDHGGNRGAIVVAFRGTYSISNTIVDLTTMPQKYVPYPSPDHGGGEPPESPSHECQNCTVHMGFLHSWKNARELVLPELKALRAKHPGYEIHLVGHSLGGSVACLAALELKVSLGWEDVTVITFGEPRVGNDRLARFVDDVFALDGETNLEDRTYRRVTHIDDPVPLLPLTEFGFKSHGGEIFISKSSLSPAEDDVHLCIGDEDPRCSAAAHSNVKAFIAAEMEKRSYSTRFKLWQILFAHRDYFWRLGLCVPGGDPFNWGKGPYQRDDL